MTVLKSKGFILLFAFLFSCTGYVPPVNYPSQGPYPNNQNPYYPNNQPAYPPYGGHNYPPIGAPRNDIDYTRRATTDPDRDATLSRAKRGDACEDERSNHRCYDLCKAMYKRADDKEECAELTPDNIEAMYDMWQALETGRLSNLEGINVEHFDWFLNVSIAGFDALVREYKRSEAEDVLVWIAEDEDVAEVMRDEDNDFETLEELLSLVDRFELDSVEEPFITEIDRKTLFEYAIDSGNDIAMDYFLDYFFQTHKSCRRDNHITIACLTLVCKIGDSIDERDRENLLNSSLFSDFAEEIIRKEVNGSNSPSGDKWVKGSGDNKIDSIKDLDDSWANPEWDPDEASKPICGGLVSS